MAVNKYPAPCAVCGATVPAHGGTLTRFRGGRGGYLVTHLTCEASGAPMVDVFTFNSGATMRQNRNGRCIDAPCCGCCDS
jgi:hypothetical protein